MMEKILEGSLASFEVPDLLTFLNMGRRTGVLVMEHPDQETKIFFKEGKPIFATSTKEELRIGNMLLRQGKIDLPTLENMLTRHRGAGQRLGEMMLKENLLKRDELASFLKIQVSEVIFDTFDWRRGMFSFFDRIPPPETAVTLEMDIQNLIMEGVRRIDERGRLSEVFPDLNMVADAVANPERIKQSVTLTREEWQVLFLVDGRRNLSEICRLAGNPDELATLQIIHNLVVANLVAVAPPREPSQPIVDEPVVPHELTQKLTPDKPQPTLPPPAVEFATPLPAPLAKEDDTHEIVSAKATRYLDKAKRVTVSRLVLVEKDRPEASFPLAKDTSTLGRHRNNDIVISDPKVSSFHARIDRTADGHTLVDLKSRNGSHVNGKRVENQLLGNGDEIRVGTARLTYRVDYTSNS
jgi:pSer/pThr/pTyr-binding forkhead associated (FHA) protein